MNNIQKLHLIKSATLQSPEVLQRELQGIKEQLERSQASRALETIVGGTGNRHMLISTGLLGSGPSELEQLVEGMSTEDMITLANDLKTGRTTFRDIEKAVRGYAPEANIDVGTIFKPITSGGSSFLGTYAGDSSQYLREDGGLTPQGISNLYGSGGLEQPLGDYAAGPAAMDTLTIYHNQLRQVANQVQTQFPGSIEDQNAYLQAMRVNPSHLSIGEDGTPIFGQIDIRIGRGVRDAVRDSSARLLQQKAQQIEQLNQASTAKASEIERLVATNQMTQEQAKEQLANLEADYNATINNLNLDLTSTRQDLYSTQSDLASTTRRAQDFDEEAQKHMTDQQQLITNLGRGIGGIGGTTIGGVGGYLGGRALGMNRLGKTLTTLGGAGLGGYFGQRYAPELMEQLGIGTAEAPELGLS